MLYCEALPMPTIFHIPVCPFSQRLEILLSLKGQRDAARFEVVDITVPRPAALLAKTRGSTSLPVLETEDGAILRESLVLLDYLEETMAGPPIRSADPVRRAIERMLVAKERDFTAAGYTFVMNRDPSRREALLEKMLGQYASLGAFLEEHNPGGTFLFDAFGWAETVFTPMFMRFWFLEYYEGFTLPENDRFARVQRWIDACLTHPAAQQVTREEIVKLYYDYALGHGNGALPPGRTRSSFAFRPDWSERPWPPPDKYGYAATDAELGLLG